jgi:hypothetical protein
MARRRKDNTAVFVVMTLVGTLAIVIIGAGIIYVAGAARQLKPPKIHVIDEVLSVDELAILMKENELRTGDSLRLTRVKVKGRISDIGRNAEGTPYAVMVPSVNYELFQFFFTDPTDAYKLDAGDMATIQAEYESTLLLHKFKRSVLLEIMKPAK